MTVSYYEPHTDADITFDVPRLYAEDKPLSIAVASLGGGDGTWICDVTYDGAVVHITTDVVTPWPHTHEQAAMVLADYLGRAESDTLAGVALKMCQDNRDRLSIWAEPIK